MSLNVFTVVSSSGVTVTIGLNTSNSPNTRQYTRAIFSPVEYLPHLLTKTERALL